jgi:hypothetical protein
MTKKLTAGVRVRSNKVNPLNANDWSLAELRRFPYVLWLLFIEPKLVIFGNEEGDCWCWGGKNRLTTTRMKLQVWAAWNVNDEKPLFRVWSVRRLVGHIFWEMPHDYTIIRNLDICNHNNCIRPSHMIPSASNKSGLQND